MLTQTSSLPNRGNIPEYLDSDVPKIRASLVLTKGNLPRFTPLALATTATGASLSIAVLSAWARGGTAAERLSYTVFQFAQLHAGARRAASVPGVVSILPLANPSVRGSTAIARDEEHARKALALPDSQRGRSSCTADHLRRTSLKPELDELDTEVAEAKRRQVAENRQAVLADRMTKSRDAMRVDPVTARLSDLIRFDEKWVALLVGLISAGVQGGIGALGWYCALSMCRRDDGVERTDIVRAANGGRDSIVTEVATDQHATPFIPDQNIDGRLQQLKRDVAEGKVPGTATGIRNHLVCALETATKLRRELLASSAVTVDSNGGRHART